MNNQSLLIIIITLLSIFILVCAVMIIEVRKIMKPRKTNMNDFLNKKQDPVKEKRNQEPSIVVETTSPFQEENQFNERSDKIDHTSVVNVTTDTIKEIIKEVDTVGCISYTDYLQKCLVRFMESYPTKIEPKTVVGIFEYYDDMMYNQYMYLINQNYNNALEQEKETSKFNSEIGAGEGFPDYMEDLRIAHPDQKLEDPSWERSMPDDECIDIIKDK